jgi:hypothetical protein
VVDKLNEKDNALAEMEQIHQENVQKAEEQAALISAGQIDPRVAGLAGHSIDDDISANEDQISSAPLGKLTGASEKHAVPAAPKSTPAQSLVQTKTESTKPKKAPVVVVEEDEDRDDFEGFGSLTELVKNKDQLIQKEMDSPEVAQALAEKHKEDEAEKKRQEEEAKQARIAKTLQATEALQNAKRKI